MKARGILLILLMGWPLVLDWESGSLASSYLVVWNVGQGQWVTVASKNGDCLHFDAGGEKNPIQQVRAICKRSNRHYLSHYDWDHLSWVRSAQSLPGFCRVGEPTETDPRRANRQRSYRQVPECASVDDRSVREITAPIASKKANDHSRVFLVDERILIPGDSPIALEKKWLRWVRSPIQILLLGHHGSRTSTGNDLVGKLGPHALTIASARQARYGHPHRDVIRRLYERRKIMLRTEDWGNIWVALPGTDGR